MKDTQQVQRLNAQIEPNNVEAEQVIIAGVFEGGSLLSLVADVLTPEMFFSSLLGAFYRASLFLRNSDRDINTLNLAAALRETGFKDLYGFESVTALVHSTYADIMGSTYVQSSAHYESAAALIRGTSIRRDLIKTCRAAITAAYDEEVTILDACTKAQDLIGEAMSASQPRSTVFEVGSAYTDRIAEFLDPEAEDSSPIIPSGYAAWDEILEGGFRGGEFTVIGGDSGIGKSMLLFGAAWNMAKFLSAQGKVGYIGSMEMSTRNVIDRWIASEAKVALSRMRRRDFSESDFERIARASSVGDLLNNLAIDEDNKATIPQILNRAKEFARKHANKHGGTGELGFIVIDNIKIAEKGGEDFGLINRYVKELKGISKDYNIPVISLSQLTKESLKGSDKRPTIDGLYGGKAIEENADDVFGLYRGEKYDDFEVPSDRAEIISLKRRNADSSGKNRKILLGYNGSLATFFDLGVPKLANPQSKQPIVASTPSVPAKNKGDFLESIDGILLNHFAIVEVPCATEQQIQDVKAMLVNKEIPPIGSVCQITRLEAKTPYAIATVITEKGEQMRVETRHLKPFTPSHDEFYYNGLKVGDSVVVDESYSLFQDADTLEDMLVGKEIPPLEAVHTVIGLRTKTYEYPTKMTMGIATLTNSDGSEIEGNTEYFRPV